MSVRTLGEIRSHLAETTRESQINDLIDNFINMTLQEINDPGWAYEVINRQGYNHNWSFNKRKDTITTVASTEFYKLPRDLDKINLVRQTTSPSKLQFVSDEVFYRRIPNPTATGSPFYYRLWSEEGVSVSLSTDDTLTVVSSSTSDDSNISVSFSGYDTNKIRRSEEVDLNGTTDVPGSITFDAGRPLHISKSSDTTGTITIKETVSGTTLLTMGEHERSPRFKVIGFYPLPSSAITINLEYYTRIRRLEFDADVPDIEDKWIWVVILGALAKIYSYQEPDSQRVGSVYRAYAAGVRSMVKSDLQNVDEIPSLRSHGRNLTPGIIEMADEQYGGWFAQR